MFFVRFLVQTVFLALGQIWANKVRAFLTTLGIVIGVAAVIAIVAATKGLESYVLKEFGTVGANKVWIFPRMPDRARDRYSYRQIRMSTREVDGLLGAAPSFLRLSPIIEMSGDVQYREIKKPLVTVRGVRPMWLDIEQREVLQGRPLMQIDEDQRSMVCLINDKAIGELGLKTECVGEDILISGRKYKIVGVIETKIVSPMFGGDEARSEVYVPFAAAEMLRPYPRMYVVAETKSPEMYDDAKAEVRGYMRRFRHLAPEEPDTFGVEAIQQYIDQFKRMSSTMTAAAMGIVAISLLVGGIGIMNIMLASVSERTREIGLRKAVGARPGVVMFQFLVEAVTLCLVGAAVGLLVGWALVLGLKLIPESPMSGAYVPTQAVVIAVLFCGFTGVIFGMFPAIKAARLDPIEALRHE